MVTGVYHPEVSGGANQCRLLVTHLKKKIDFRVLATTRNPNLSSRSHIDGIDVYRVLIKKSSLWYFLKASLKFTTFFLSRRKDFTIVHLHGFSLKSVFLTLLSKIFDKKIINKMTSVGHDDPEAMKKRGLLLNYFFSKADAYVGINPHFESLYLKSQLPADRLKLIPNGVDTTKFYPVTHVEKRRLMNELGLPGKLKMILFVGHFSREKSPDILLEAWKQHVAEKFPDTGIIFIGSTNPDHYEVDSELVNDILQQAQPFINERIFFIGKTQEIDKVYKAVDMIVLPSLREGLSNSLLESMACRLPVVVSHLEGITDWVVTDGVNGLLVEPANRDDLGNAMMHILDDDVLAESLGQEARETIVERFSIQKVAQDYLQLYDELTS